MKIKKYLNWEMIEELAHSIVSKYMDSGTIIPEKLKIAAVPRGGFVPAIAIAKIFENDYDIYTVMTNNVEEADIIIDDIIDSGKTKKKYEKYNIPFYALIDLQNDQTKWKDNWIVFPWEVKTEEIGPTDNIVRLLEFIGENPEREGLAETPKRVISAYQTLFSGYAQLPENILKIFKDEKCDEMVLLKDIEVYSTCEHHMLPFYGKAHIAYIPKNGVVVGISKLARLLDMFAKRLQIQERICEQVTDALMNYLEPLGAACVLECRHFCMTSRGVQKQNSIMITSSLKGVFQTKPEARAEFMSMIK